MPDARVGTPDDLDMVRINPPTILYFGQASRTSDFMRLFTAEADWRLEAGMGFHMYASAGAGVAFSETVLVTGGDPERLSRTERRPLRRGGDMETTACTR